MKIVIVDDDELSRRLLARSLQTQSFSTIECSDGRKAVAILEKEGPALVVLDYQMPELNGAEICALIREHSTEHVAQSPIILLTAHSGEEHEIASLKAGANDFVSKPVNVAVLTARIQTQMRLHAMRAELQQQKSELQKWRTAHEFDLEAARLTQQAIIPQRLPSIAGWDFAARYQPLIQVGGDMYDYLPLSGDRLLIWIADATGHGASAALLTTLAKLLFRHAAAEKEGPAEILAAVNDGFHSIFKGRSFMTVCCAVLQSGSGRVVTCGAGHPPALIARTDGDVEQLMSSAPPIGVSGDTSFAAEENSMEKGDALLLYTDGIYGARAADGIRLAPADFARMLPQPKHSAAEFLDAIFASLHERHTKAEPSDDVAAVAATRR